MIARNSSSSFLTNNCQLQRYREYRPESLLKTFCGICLLLLPLLGRHQLIQHVLFLLFSILGQGTSQEGKINIQILMLGLLVCLSNVLILLRGPLKTKRKNPITKVALIPSPAVSALSTHFVALSPSCWLRPLQPRIIKGGQLLWFLLSDLGT